MWSIVLILIGLESRHTFETCLLHAVCIDLFILCMCQNVSEKAFEGKFKVIYLFWYLMSCTWILLVLLLKCECQIIITSKKLRIHQIAYKTEYSFVNAMYYICRTYYLYFKTVYSAIPSIAQGENDDPSLRCIVQMRIRFDKRQFWSRSLVLHFVATLTITGQINTWEITN